MKYAFASKQRLNTFVPSCTIHTGLSIRFESFKWYGKPYLLPHLLLPLGYVIQISLGMMYAFASKQCLNTFMSSCTVHSRLYNILKF